MYIAIAGNIGVGKTTLTSLLARHYGFFPAYEKIEDNPYLNDFHQDMERWSFNLQIYTLQKKVAQILSIQNSEQSVIQDRTIYEDIAIFSAHLHSIGLLSERDYDSYLSFSHLAERFIQAPDLIIYLKADTDTLIQHLQHKDRLFEKSIHVEYLKSLNQRYEQWANQYKKGKLITIDVHQNQFHQLRTDLEKIIVQVDKFLPQFLVQ